MLRTTTLAFSTLALALAPLAPALQAREGAEIPSLGVHLRLESAPDLRLAVQVTVLGEQDGETAFAVSKDWGGVPPERIDLLDASAQDSLEKELHVKRDSNVQWTVQHDPGATITLTTWLLPAELRNSGDSADHYRPLLEPDLFQAVGHLLVPRPMLEGAEDEKVRLDLSFSGFEEAGWSVAHSFGLGSGPVSVEETRSRISGMLFNAGEIQVGTREIRGGTIALALDSTKWKFEGEELTELAAEVVNLQREFMDDDGAPFYFISAIRVGPDNSPGFSLGGTGLTNSFALFMQSNTVIAPDSVMGPEVLKLLSHECFHEYNGTRIRLAQPDVRNYWFSEGFTEYFARQLLLEDQLLDPGRYVQWLNETLRSYHESPVRNLPAVKLAKIFWSDMNGQQQPYLRGELVAILAEHAIRQHTGGEKTLADYMRVLLAKSSAQPSLRFDTQRLLEELGAFTGPEILPTLRSICVDGATAVLPPDVLGERFVFEATQSYAFEAGFDTNASSAALRVMGLVEDSAAHKAGLLEGDAILALNMEAGRTDIPIAITVRSSPDVAPRKLSYYPRGKEIQLPRVRLAKE